MPLVYPLKRCQNNSMPHTSSFNKRILIRNSQKYIYKKLCTTKKNQWCDDYLSVVTTKLADPLSKTKLPHSLSKRTRNHWKQDFQLCSRRRTEFEKNVSCSNSNQATMALKSQQKIFNSSLFRYSKKIHDDDWKHVKVFSVCPEYSHNIVNQNISKENMRMKTIEEGQLLKMGRESYQNLVNTKKSRLSFKVKNLHKKVILRKNSQKHQIQEKQNIVRLQQNQLTPWHNEEQEDLKQIRFFH